TELEHGNAELAATIVNRADAERSDDIVAAVRQHTPHTPVWAIPEDRLLVAPTMGDILRAVEGELVKGDEALLSREALHVVVAGMSMVNILPRLTEGAVVIIPADRSDALLATLMANNSANFPSLAGIVLNGPFEIPDAMQHLVEGLASSIPIIRCMGDTYPTAVRIMHTRGRLAASSAQRYNRALSLFEK